MERIYHFILSRGGWEYGQWIAIEADGGEDWDGDSEGWHYCGSVRGIASNIQDAIDELIERICERDGVDDIKYSWI